MSSELGISIESTGSVAAVDSKEWDALVGDQSPFMEHAFLAALENTGCVGEGTGWYPVILTARKAGRLVGAVPMYIKTHSRGEFVFDWAWADAAQRAGIAYYPKAVVAVPFTPVTGVRLLIDSTFEAPDALRLGLIQACTQAAESLGLSSVHFNFVTEHEKQLLSESDIPTRIGVQYHWSNPQGDARYTSFQDYLTRLKSKKRANIRRERRLLAASGVTTRTLVGTDIGHERMQRMYQYYVTTVRKFYWGHQYLSEDFFMALYDTMPERIHVVVAEHDGEEFAGAFNLVKGDRLYGRYWGCTREIQYTHFEVCMYASIEWCIDHDVDFFEPGAGGEHKFARGFEATQTQSAHHIREPALEDAIRQFLGQETDAVGDHIGVLNRRGAFKG